MKAITYTFAAFTSFGALFLATQAAQAEMDANGDGVFSYEEMLTVYPELSEDVYTSIDVNTDGAIDAAELAAATEAGVLPSQG